MRIVEKVAELQRLADAERAAGRTLALVPTMGALHAAHLSLAREARKRADRVWVSIFVNPTQFDEPNDLAKYPRCLDADLAACERAGVDAVFLPDAGEMYPTGSQTWVEVSEVAAPLCGRTRPGHFRGVTTIVAKLLLAAKPHVAVFGEKDYQQLLAIEAMVAAGVDRWPTLRIERHATVRDADGLAMSSRNAFLDAGQREHALALSRALGEAVDAASPAAAESTMARVLAEHDVVVEYAAVRDATSLGPIDTFARPARALIAARVDAVRLIDNAALGTRRG